MYADYNEIELANKDLEELNDEVELMMENTKTMLADLRTVKEKLGIKDENAISRPKI